LFQPSCTEGEDKAMATIRIRPDLRTACGEICDIVVNGKYAGTCVLVYREKERLSGSIQLDRDSLSPRTKHQVVRHMNEYVQSLVDALQTPECDVIVTYSRYDHVIASEHNVGVIESFSDEPEFEVDVDLDTRYDDGDPAEREWLEMQDDDVYDSDDEAFDIVLTRDDGDTLTYDIYDHSHGDVSVGTATVDISGSDISGFIEFRDVGNEEEREAIASILMQEIDKQREFDTCSLTMLYQNEPFEEVLFENEALH